MTDPGTPINANLPFYWTRQGISLQDFLARVDAALALLQDATGLPQLGTVGLKLYTADDPAVARAALELGAGGGGGVSGSGPNGQFIALDVKDSTDVGRSVLTAAGVDLAARKLAAVAAIGALAASLLGQPNGVAKLNALGQVVDSAGNPAGGGDPFVGTAAIWLDTDVPGPTGVYPVRPNTTATPKRPVIWTNPDVEVPRTGTIAGGTVAAVVDVDYWAS